MSSGLLSINVQLAGLAMSLSAVREGEGQISQVVTLPKAWAGTLSTRTTDVEGVITTTAAHDITIADFITIFSDGAVAYYGNVSDVDTNEITFAAALGDVLPLENAAVIAGAEVTINTDFDGDDVAIIAAQCPARAQLQFIDTLPSEALEKELLAGAAWFWVSGMGWTNPLAGDPVDYIRAAQADINSTKNVQIGILYDSTP
jgi:hypothetical protein